MLWTKQNITQDKQSLIQNNIGLKTKNNNRQAVFDTESHRFKQCRIYVWMDLNTDHTDIS